MTSHFCCLNVAIKTPLRRYFDYLPPHNTSVNQIEPGTRVLLPFGKKPRTVGLVLSSSDKTNIEKSKLKRVIRIIDGEPVISRKHLDLLIWASRYYHHPIGEVIFQSLPAKLGTDRFPATMPVTNYWTAAKKNTGNTATLSTRASRQKQIYAFICGQENPVSEKLLTEKFGSCRQPVSRLFEKGLIENTDRIFKNQIKVHDSNITLSRDQQHAIAAIRKISDCYNPILLDGVTGSGKTEIYLRAIEDRFNKNLQVLVLLPEIGLTPQLISRFKERFDAEIVVQHSGLSQLERYNGWMSAKQGRASIILGTRSAVWTPLANPGLYIVDEEHDLSYKQQDTFRYSARDIALVRAKRDKVPIILGSATPSMETLQNVESKKIHALILPARVGNSSPVTYNIVDLRGTKMHGAVSQTLATHIQSELKNKHQVLLFLNRRGYADHLLCHECGDKVICPHCEYPYTYHKSRNLLICHHCEAQKNAPLTCRQCGKNTLSRIGYGTERIEETLLNLFPNTNIVRFDRDTTRRKNAMQLLLNEIEEGRADIIIGTQMLAKGHHFPNITLTGIIDADRGLFGSDYRAGERLAQLLIQVSGRAGRGSKRGKVLIQTHYPDHNLLQTLINSGYREFSKKLLTERKAALLPPFTYHALLRAEANRIAPVNDFLIDAKNKLISMKKHKIDVLGPVVAPIEKRSGRYRMQLLIQSGNRKTLHQTISPWIDYLDHAKLGKKIRWSIDIDPQDML